MAETATKKDTKKNDEPSVEDRLDRIEAALGLGPVVAEEPATVPPGPPQVLYAPPSDEEVAAEEERQKVATAAAEKAA